LKISNIPVLNTKIQATEAKIREGEQRDLHVLVEETQAREQATYSNTEARNMGIGGIKVCEASGTHDVFDRYENQVDGPSKRTRTVRKRISGISESGVRETAGMCERLRGDYQDEF
jgi:hypothetical protein